MRRRDFLNRKTALAVSLLWCDLYFEIKMIYGQRGMTETVHLKKYNSFNFSLLFILFYHKFMYEKSKEGE